MLISNEKLWVSEIVVAISSRQIPGFSVLFNLLVFLSNLVNLGMKNVLDIEVERPLGI